MVSPPLGSPSIYKSLFVIRLGWRFLWRGSHYQINPTSRDKRPVAKVSPQISAEPSATSSEVEEKTGSSKSTSKSDEESPEESSKSPSNSSSFSHPFFFRREDLSTKSSEKVSILVSEVDPQVQQEVFEEIEEEVIREEVTPLKTFDPKVVPCKATPTQHPQSLLTCICNYLCKKTMDNGYNVPVNTDCLEEFLGSLQLSHLTEYLRVLGCTCVRDLRLLEAPQLEAIQLINRRRLLKHLEKLEFQTEAIQKTEFHGDLGLSPGGLSDAEPHDPSEEAPHDASLEDWLKWYGLSHIQGFLMAIGVNTVADIELLQEEDLQLLKPITRRRFLACNKKYC
ncbi:uncharacterized protein LOC143033407 isoform X3 [Oratosquilla oratoria]|uniref:uncharacterized protein LOC143033407 isoform X3 n=1 Tax=Oratosquilla oratoria TaxID=337810 RepID=UPI003F773183